MNKCPLKDEPTNKEIRGNSREREELF